LLACTESADDAPEPAWGQVVDAGGDVVTLQAPARRIVSLVPSHTDAIVALGAADRMIARTQWDEYAVLADLPSIDDALTPSVEWLVSQRPDLVIAWPDLQARTVVARLRQFGIPVYASGVESVADARRSLSDLGRMLGLEGRADSILAGMDAVLDSVRADAASRPRYRFVYLIGLEPPFVAGPGSFIDELLSVSGGDNLFRDSAQPWPQVGVEAILARDPDVVIVSTASAEATDRLRTVPGWRDLRAVREGRLFHVDPSLINRPGPNVVIAARALSGLLSEVWRRSSGGPPP
jgi:iron complex transport system substrate-binding protein